MNEANANRTVIDLGPSIAHACIHAGVGNFYVRYSS